MDFAPAQMGFSLPLLRLLPPRQCERNVPGMWNESLVREFRTAHLVAHHCYMVDHVTFSGSKVMSVTLRNPWGDDSINDGYLT